MAHQQADPAAGCVEFVRFPGLQTRKHFANGLLYRVKLRMTKIHICSRLPALSKLLGGTGVRGGLYKIATDRGLGGKSKLPVQCAAMCFNAAKRK